MRGGLARGCHGCLLGHLGLSSIGAACGLASSGLGARHSALHARVGQVQVLPVSLHVILWMYVDLCTCSMVQWTQQGLCSTRKFVLWPAQQVKLEMGRGTAGPVSTTSGSSSRHAHYAVPGSLHGCTWPKLRRGSQQAVRLHHTVPTLLSTRAGSSPSSFINPRGDTCLHNNSAQAFHRCNDTQSWPLHRLVGQPFSRSMRGQ